MKFLEKNLEDIIWETDNEKLQERGLEISGKKYRQMNLGLYGIADIVTVERLFEDVNYFSSIRSYLNITIYELKKETICSSTFFQALKYCRAIQLHLNGRGTSTLYKLNIVLVGSNINANENGFSFLPNLISNSEYFCLNSVTNISYKYDFDGLTFEYHRNYYIQQREY